MEYVDPFEAGTGPVFHFKVTHQLAGPAMCSSCIKSEFPDRVKSTKRPTLHLLNPAVLQGRMCLDSGTYMANLRACSSCGTKDLVEVEKMLTVSDESEAEVVCYKRNNAFKVLNCQNLIPFPCTDVCRRCNHLVATHNHTFVVEGDYQEYEME